MKNRFCTICLMKLEEKDNIQALPCMHVFHQECIYCWFKEKKICPVCRFDCNEYINIESLEIDIESLEIDNTDLNISNTEVVSVQESKCIYFSLFLIVNILRATIIFVTSICTFRVTIALFSFLDGVDRMSAIISFNAALLFLHFFLGFMEISILYRVWLWINN